MSNVYKFPESGIKLIRLYCDDCNSPLQYWVSDDWDSYGLCHTCDLYQPDEVILTLKKVH
jgi:hypothetical protein